MDYEAFKSAITAGQGAGVPSSPLGSFPEVAGLFKSQFQLGETQAPTAGLISNARTDYSNEQEAASAARSEAVRKAKEEADAIKQAIEDMQNPNKYQQVKKDDGGFDYFDPIGNKISVAKYAKIKGKPVHEVLSDSENLLDRQFRAEYDLLKQFTEASYNGDEEKKIDLMAKNPALELLDKGNVDDTWRAFIEYYPNYFRENNVDANPRGQQRNIQADLEERALGAKRNAPRSNFQKLKDLINPFG